MGSADGGLTSRGCCGYYNYMRPGYIPDDQLDDGACYSAIGNALLENSSAHGLPTFYRAQGNTLEHWLADRQRLEVIRFAKGYMQKYRTYHSGTSIKGGKGRRRARIKWGTVIKGTRMGRKRRGNGSDSRRGVQQKFSIILCSEALAQCFFSAQFYTKVQF